MDAPKDFGSLGSKGLEPNGDSFLTKVEAQEVETHFWVSPFPTYAHAKLVSKPCSIYLFTYFKSVPAGQPCSSCLSSAPSPFSPHWAFCPQSFSFSAL